MKTCEMIFKTTYPEEFWKQTEGQKLTGLTDIDYPTL